MDCTLLWAQGVGVGQTLLMAKGVEEEQEKLS
jgi:hypothetical protein